MQKKSRKSKPKQKTVPLPRGAVRIYDQIIRIEGEKKRGPHKGKWYHDFATEAAIYGLPDGSILIR